MPAYIPERTLIKIRCEHNHPFSLRERFYGELRSKVHYLISTNVLCSASRIYVGVLNFYVFMHCVLLKLNLYQAIIHVKHLFKIKNINIILKYRWSISICFWFKIFIYKRWGPFLHPAENFSGRIMLLGDSDFVCNFYRPD